MAMSCSASAANTLLRQLDMELVSLKRQVRLLNCPPDLVPFPGYTGAVLPPAGSVVSHGCISGAECQTDEQRTETRSGGQCGRVQTARGMNHIWKNK